MKTLKRSGMIWLSTLVGVAFIPFSALAQGGRGQNQFDEKKYPAFYVKAETSKEKLYKGEQLIVSYYLYERVRTVIRDVPQYPTFQGFLRDDLEIPVVNSNVQFQPAETMDGIPYERALLARYALYPIKEGTLRVDTLAVKGEVGGMSQIPPDITRSSPFFRRFFQNLVPKISVQRSTPLKVEVMPLPPLANGVFSGAVGLFELNSNVDRTDLKTFEPATINISLRGQGNTSVVLDPKLALPDGVEVYEKRARTKMYGGGVTEKTFEIVLIAKRAGELAIPSIEFITFEPDRKEYAILKTSPFTLKVVEGDTIAPAATPVDSTAGTEFSKAPSESTPAVGRKDDIRYLKLESSESDEATSILGYVPWRWLSWLSLAAFLILSGLVGYDLFRKGIRKAKNQKILRLREVEDTQTWRRVEEKASSLQKSQTNWEDVSKFYEFFEKSIHRELQRTFGGSFYGIVRAEAKSRLLGQHRVKPETWAKLEHVLEYIEEVQFGHKSGAMSLTEVKSDIPKWISLAKNSFNGIKPAPLPFQEDEYTDSV